MEQKTFDELVERIIKEEYEKLIENKIEEHMRIKRYILNSEIFANLYKNYMLLGFGTEVIATDMFFIGIFVGKVLTEVETLEKMKKG